MASLGNLQLFIGLTSSPVEFLTHEPADPRNLPV
jgi:hypothetical protein